MQGQYLFGDIPMDPNDDALHPPWVTVPNAMAQFSAFGLGPTPYTAPPDAPGGLQAMAMMPPLPGMPDLPTLTAGPAPGDGPNAGQSPQGGGFSDWALPLAAGLAGAASGYATHGNPQTVLQGLSLAHRAQLMPKPEQLQQQQQQKMIHDLIMSGKLSPQALQRLGQQYPWAAPYTEAMLPTAQRQAKLQSFVEGQIPGFNGPPPAPVEAAPGNAAPASAQGGPSAPSLPASGGSSAPGFTYLPDMAMDSKGDVTMGIKPHAQPKPSDLEQRLAAIRGGQAQAPDERIALGLDKPFEQSKALEADKAIQAIDQQLAVLQAQQQASPHPLLGRRINELTNTREMLSQTNQFNPQSPAGKLAFDLEVARRRGDTSGEQALQPALTGSSRMPMETAQGKAGEDVRMLQQGRDMAAGDTQLQSAQAEADAASLGKDVGNAMFQRQGLDSVGKQFGTDSPEYKDAQTVYGRDVLKNKVATASDIGATRGDFMQQTKDFNTTRDFYRQVETVLRSGNPNAMADISFITAMAKILDPGSVVRPSESGQIETNSRIIPDSIKLTFENWINHPQLLTGTQRNDLINTVRQAYVSRLQSVDQLKNAYGGITNRQFPGTNPEDVVGTVPYDAIDLAYLRGRPARTADIQAAAAQAAKLGQPALAPFLLLQQGINPFAEIQQ